MWGSYRFAPRLVPTLAAFLAIALTVSLGRWQTNRTQEKEARQALLEARIQEMPVRLTGSVDASEPLLFRKVRATGRWLVAGQIFVDNQIREGRAGFHVVTPLQIEGSGAFVLVNRGWIARSADYPRAPEVPVPAGIVMVSGIATVPPARVLELSPDTVAGNVWQNLSIEKYRTQTRLAVLPVVVLADAPAAGLVVVTETPDAGVAKHREYALTWFALASTVAGLWLVFAFRRKSP